MAKNLVIVESPAKAKTIGNFLGKDYEVLSSYGHIRDLKKKELSVDINTFEPQYEIPAEKKKLVNELKTEAKKADTVWLASDEDREGEAISWHLYNVLNLKPENTKRIVFHEITKPAILNAIKHPRTIDQNLVNAQQARRVLDRIVGFKLSPVLWKRVKPALSAGRVQSVAVRLIVEREHEIRMFKSESWYKVNAIFTVTGDNGKQSGLKAELNLRFKTEEEAKNFLVSCKDATFTIEDITTKPSKRYPAPPFTTSTLQQEAARKLGFTVAQTMRIAQQLYESGKITYMRTDSVNLSELCINACKQSIAETMGERYLHNRHFVTKTKGAQEAHEAIRPTHIELPVIEGDSQEKRLYNLIWKRTIASQMAEAELEKTTVTIAISGQDAVFSAVGEVIKFDGFLKVYSESKDDDSEQEDQEGLLPPMHKGEELHYQQIFATERFTQHPPRYTEASLVHKLEELGIGRPSTYAPTISTIQQRGYVEKETKEGIERPFTQLVLENGDLKSSQLSETTGYEKNKLVPTDVGIVVNQFLMEFFPTIMDYNFTANVEKDFDEVAEGKEEWKSLIKGFYKSFEPTVENSLETKSEHKIGERVLGNDPQTGKPVSVKIGRFGPVVQIGSAQDAEKPRFAQMKKDQSLETITLEEALELFKLPRNLGQFEDNEVIIGAGRFGPYIKHDGKYISIPKGTDPLQITLEEAIELIQQKRQAEKEKHIKSFTEEPDLEILNGRYGPYISYKKKNYHIPKGQEPKELTLEQCKELIKKEEENPTPRKRTFKRKKA